LQRNLCAGIQAERHGDRTPHELFLATRLARAPPRGGADQPGADHHCRYAVNNERHHHLREFACGARAYAGTLRRECRIGHNKPATVDVAAKAKRDIRSLIKDDAMTISCGQKLSEDTTAAYGGFERR
jgi:hypothetical protein